MSGKTNSDLGKSPYKNPEKLKQKKNKWYFRNSKYDEIKNEILSIIEIDAKSAEEISKELDHDIRYIQRTLKRMHKEGLVNKYQINNFGKIGYVKNLNYWEL